MGSTSWGSPWALVITGARVNFSFDWGIDRSGPATPGSISCGVSRCFVGFLPRTGLGNNGQLCDSGGACAGSSPSLSTFLVVVPNNTSWEDAYSAYINKYGTTGHTTTAGFSQTNSMSKWGWGSLCIGFASLPVGRRAVSKLAPGSTCGLVSKPNISCNVSLGSEIDLGIVAPGSVLPQGSVRGAYSCIGGVGTISSAVIGSPLLAGLPVDLQMNDVKLTSTPQIVSAGELGELRLTAHPRGSLATAGTYQSSVALLINYY